MISDFRFEISDLPLVALPGLHDGLSSCIAALQSQIYNLQSQIPLAWRPFLDPAPIDRYWLWLLPPLVLVVAVVYRTVKSESLESVPRRAGTLALQIGVFIVLAAALLWLLLLFV